MIEIILFVVLYPEKPSQGIPFLETDLPKQPHASIRSKLDRKISKQSTKISKNDPQKVLKTNSKDLKLTMQQFYLRSQLIPD